MVLHGECGYLPLYHLRRTIALSYAARRTRTSIFLLYAKPAARASIPECLARQASSHEFSGGVSCIMRATASVRSRMGVSLQDVGGCTELASLDEVLGQAFGQGDQGESTCVVICGMRKLRTMLQTGEGLYPMHSGPGPSTGRTRLPQTLPLSASYQQPFNVSMLPSAHIKASAPMTKLFRGSITRPVHSLSTLRSVSYLTTT
jgi:hypothetical protein